MIINVKLYATFRNLRFTAQNIELNAIASVRDVAQLLTIKESELGIILLNSRHVQVTALLAEGDTLALFPVIGGG